MTKSKADFVVVPVGTPMPREHVEARIARLREIIPQYEGMVDIARNTRGESEAGLVQTKIKEFQAKLAELEGLLKVEH